MVKSKSVEPDSDMNHFKYKDKDKFRVKRQKNICHTTNKKKSWHTHINIK